MVDKNSIFGGMITTQGAAKKTNCDALGIPWEPRYMLIGDANGTDPVPNPSQTKLVNQVHRAQINQLRVSPTDANVLIAEVVLPPDVGGWWVRELALEDKDGVFSAVANAPPSYKPVLAQGSGRNQVVRMHIITSGTSNIQLKIDPSVVLATRQYVDEAVGGLLPANKPAGTYTKVTVNDRGVFVSGSNPTTLAGYGITDTYTKDQITAMIAQASALPVGSMIGFPVNKVAPGFLELDGSVKSAAAYPDLATFLGGVFNKGDEGAGNFRLPESRGEFLRGWDHGRGVDAGRAIGSWQEDMFKSHTHRLQYGNQAGPGLGSPGYSYPNQLSNTGVEATGGSETRPRNLAVMWCIKAWNAPINQGNIDISALALELDKHKNLAVLGGRKNLKLSASGLNAVVSISADQLIVGTGERVRSLSAVSLSVNGLVVGANGLDINALQPSMWYSVWVIFNESEKAGLLSLSATSPTMPAGFVDKARVGWVRTDASKAFWKFIQTDCFVEVDKAPATNISILPALASGTTGGTAVAVSVSNYVPPTATHIKCLAYANAAAGNAVGVFPSLAYALVSDYSYGSGPAGSGVFQTSMVVDIMLRGTSIAWVSQGTGNLLNLIGWRDAL